MARMMVGRGCRRALAFGAAFVWLSAGQSPRAQPLTPGRAEAPAKGKAGDGFAEPRGRDGAGASAALVTPESERACASGLAWLAAHQDAGGSFGSGSYRGNIAITSLAGLAFM